MRRAFIILLLPLLSVSLLLLPRPSTGLAAGKRAQVERSPGAHKGLLASGSKAAAPPVTLWVAMLETQAEGTKSAPDWSITGSGLTTVPAGTAVNFAQYFQIYKSPSATVNVTYRDLLYLGNTTFSSQTSSGTLNNDPSKDFRRYYGPFTLKKAGTYTYWCTLTIGSTSFSDEGKLVVQ